VDDPNLDHHDKFVGETLLSIIKNGGAEVPEDAVPFNPAKCSPRAIKAFPTRLMDILCRLDVSDSISWLPHGRSFIVRDVESFMREVYPRFFKPGKYRSFQRQLNLWGFKRITKGIDRGSYYHQLFLRGMLNLAKRMFLNKEKKGVRSSPNPEEEPDFYALAALRPLPELEPAYSPLPPKQSFPAYNEWRVFSLNP